MDVREVRCGHSIRTISRVSGRHLYRFRVIRSIRDSHSAARSDPMVGVRDLDSE